MEGKLTKESVKKLMEIKGEARGIVFKTDADFVLAEKGKAALEEVEKRSKELGAELKYEEIETMDFYPIGLRAVSLLVVQEVLGLSDKDIERMGRKAPKTSLIIKLFMKFFLSIEKTAEQVPKMWEKHYTVGKLESEASGEKRYAMTRLTDFNIHPAFCPYFKGYFSTVVKMVVKSPIISKEKKCAFQGDDCHEYLLRW